MATVSLRGVKKRYGTTQVVHGVDLEVADGEFLVMVGPSGCGKSTLLRMVAGLETVSEGGIAIGGRMVNDLEPKDRDIAMVFQNYALYPHMSVFENMAYGLRVRGLNKREIETRVGQAAGILGLTDYLPRRPRQLSGGQRQRVAMGRAIVREPSVFLLDEPLSNLDAKLRNQMRVELKKLHQQLAGTFLYVTHDQVEAMTLGQRIMVMQGGRVEQIGTPAEVYDTPASSFVAEFIGFPAMNVLKGRLNNSRGILSVAGQELPVCGNLPDRDEVRVGIRPENLHAGNGAGERPRSLDAVVELAEPLGGDTIVHCVIPATGESGVRVRTLTGQHPREGDRVTLGFRPRRLHLFDVGTGRRLEGISLDA